MPDAIVGPFVGAAIAGLFAFAGVLISTRREHVRWLREERQRSCSQLLAIVDRMVFTQGLSAAEDEHRTEVALTEGIGQIGAVKAELILLLPAETYSSAKQLLAVLHRHLAPEDGDHASVEDVARSRDAFALEARRLIVGRRHA